jgi:2-hydroxy-3-keto-5-methylthiopentenyl-1-phosphate phosphatase
LKSPILTTNQSAVFFTDFDGTITVEDTLVLLLDQFSRPTADGNDWRSIEDNPEIPENIKLQMEMDLLDCGLQEALSWLAEHVVIREGFVEFVNYLNDSAIEINVLSGGFTSIIQQTLQPLGLEAGINIFANDIRVEANRWTVIPAKTPRIKSLCNHCKSWHLVKAKAENCITIYAGDGSTDFCASKNADIIFATASLIEYMNKANLSCLEFTDFYQIGKVLSSMGILPTWKYEQPQTKILK